MTAADDLDQRLVPVDGLLVSVLDGEAVLVVPGTLVAVLVNGAAVEILSLLDGEARVRDVATALAARHGGTASDYADDVVTAVHDLRSTGAVVDV